MKMKTGTHVRINLNVEDARKLGIAAPIIDQPGVIDGPFTNGVDGHFVKTNGKLIAIADKYNALTEVA